MIIDCYSTDKFALDYIAKTMDDEVVSVQDILDNKQKEIFSEKPYVFVMDYSNIFSISLIAKFFKIKFSGSKILYCVYTAPEYRTVFSETAKIITQCKGFILFGSCSVGMKGDSIEKYAENLNALACEMKNCSPLKNVGNLSFPIRIKSKQDSNIQQVG